MWTYIYTLRSENAQIQHWVVRQHPSSSQMQTHMFTICHNANNTYRTRNNTPNTSYQKGIDPRNHSDIIFTHNNQTLTHKIIQDVLFHVLSYLYTWNTQEHKVLVIEAQVHKHTHKDTNTQDRIPHTQSEHRHIQLAICSMLLIF